jgi:hypothetical protein
MRRIDWRGAGVFVSFAAAALVLGTGAPMKGQALAQQAPTPPVIVTTSPGPAAPSAIIILPATPIPSLTPLPVTPTATPAPRRGRRRASPTASPGATASPGPTATPTSPAFSTLDGNWEVQVQRIDTTLYSRFTVKQDGTSVTGTWFVDGGQVPLQGTYDGRLFHFVANDPKKGKLDLTGYVENASDMVGIVDNGKGDVPFQNPLAFTAEHRGNKVAYPKKKG